METQRPPTAAIVRLVCLSCLENDPGELKGLFKTRFVGASSIFTCSIHPTIPYLKFRTDGVPSRAPASMADPDPAYVFGLLRRYVKDKQDAGEVRPLLESVFPTAGRR